MLSKDLEINVTTRGVADARAELASLQGPLLQRFVWRGRYFLAYAFTLGMLLVPLLLGKMEGAAYGTACTWMFGALVGGAAASRAAKGFDRPAARVVDLEGPDRPAERG